MLIWQVLDGLCHHLLLMMSLDCLLAIHHKKGGVHIVHGDRGSFLFWGSFFVLGYVDCI